MSWQEKSSTMSRMAPLLDSDERGGSPALQLMTEIGANVSGYLADPTGPGIHRPERRPV
jgi:hypothetical protein